MPCSLVRCRILLGTCLLAEIFSSTLKIEAIYSSKTLVASQQTTRRHIPKDDTLHNHGCENLKSYKEEVVQKLSGMVIKTTSTVYPCEDTSRKRTVASAAIVITSKTNYQ
jgi:hypothetical protein